MNLAAITADLKSRQRLRVRRYIREFVNTREANDAGYSERTASNLELVRRQIGDYALASKLTNPFMPKRRDIMSYLVAPEFFNPPAQRAIRGAAAVALLKEEALCSAQQMLVAYIMSESYDECNPVEEQTARLVLEKTVEDVAKALEEAEYALSCILLDTVIDEMEELLKRVDSYQDSLK